MVKGLETLRGELEDVAQDFELHLGPVYTNGAATNLNAIDDNVIMLRDDLLGRRVEQRDVLGTRCRERVVLRHEAL